MRAFISLNLDLDTRKESSEIQGLVKDKISELNSNFLNAIKWEPMDKFHMTMFFIGELNSEKQKEVMDNLAMINLNTDRELKFDAISINAFPKLKFPRVIILELINENKNVFLLSEKINEQMKSCGFTNDKKFHPHITLGRVKRDKKINLNELRNVSIGKLSFSVNSFYLMQSKLKSTGSEYTVLKEYKL